MRKGSVKSWDRANRRFVTVKSIKQPDLQGLHRIRQSVVKPRTALANQIRGLLGEYGIIVAKGISQVRTRIPEILEDAENGLTDRFRGWLAELLEALRALDERIKQYDQEIQREHAANEVCQRLSAIEGVGPPSATAVVASYGDGKPFSDSRQFSASIGLVPRQHTTGDKPILLGISKRGDKYIRTRLIHGARSVINQIEGKEDRRSRWLRRWWPGAARTRPQWPWLTKTPGLSGRCSRGANAIVGQVERVLRSGTAFPPFAHRPRIR
jgi:transposase